jgi:Flp pilus assembly protein TadD
VRGERRARRERSHERGGCERACIGRKRETGEKHVGSVPPAAWNQSRRDPSRDLLPRAAIGTIARMSIPRRVAPLLLAAALSACASIEAASLERSGLAALDRGDPAGAIADLERAAALAPGASAIQNHLGIAYEQAGRHDDALRAYQQAVELDCDNAAAQVNLDALREGAAAAP